MLQRHREMAERKVPKGYPLEKTPEAAEARRKWSFAASKKAHDKIVAQIKKGVRFRT